MANQLTALLSQLKEDKALILSCEAVTQQSNVTIRIPEDLRKELKATPCLI